MSLPYSTREEVLGVRTYQLMIRNGSTLIDMTFYVLQRFEETYYLYFLLNDFGFKFSIYDNGIKLYLDVVLYGCVHNLDGYLYWLLMTPFIVLLL